MKHIRWGSVLVILLVLTVGWTVLFGYEETEIPPEVPVPAPPLQEPELIPTIQAPAPVPEQKPKELPSSFDLPIPFTVQAPTGNWDKLHNEACEEASAIMASAYFAGDTRTALPALEVEKQFSLLTLWQNKNFGYSLDATAEETAQMIRAVYGLQTELVSDFTESDVKEALLDNQVVIIPVNGRKLGNLYFRQPGPIYHMLVIRGYDGDSLVTNDSGTKRGEKYRYLFETIKNAVADWNHTTGTIDDGTAIMIVVSK